MRVGIIVRDLLMAFALVGSADRAKMNPELKKQLELLEDEVGRIALEEAMRHDKKTS